MTGRLSHPPETSPGLFDVEGIPDADTAQLMPFSTTGWAEMDILFVSENGVDKRYPYFADGFVGYIRDCPQNHPLHIIEQAIRGNLHTQSNLRLRRLSCLVGQAISPEGDYGIKAWERDCIGDIFGELTDRFGLEKPTPKWGKSDFGKFYEAIRKKERTLLLPQVASLAGQLAAQNQTEQMYVARVPDNNSETGWLAPLVGLSVDQKVTNGYRYQVHDVVPVVKQLDGVVSLLRGASGNLYTADTHPSL